MSGVASKYLVPLCVLVALAGCGTGEGGAPQEPVGQVGQEVVEWTGSLGTARSHHTATLLLDGRVLVAGGENSSGTFSSAELYNPATGTWTRTGSMQAGRSTHRAVLLDDGRVLVMGGYTSSSTGTLATAELYDPATGTWTQTGSLNQRRRYHGAARLANGRVLVMGGLYNLNDSYLYSAETYDPATGTWTFLSSSLSVSRMNPTALLLPDGRVAVMGGQAYSGAQDVSAQVELFNPATNTFSVAGSLSVRRHFAGFAVLADGRVLAAGGSSGTAPNTAELYDPATQTSQPTGALVTGRSFFTLTRIDATRVLAVGGSDGNLKDLASIEQYDTTTGTWSPLAALHTARGSHSATLLNGTAPRLLIAGGANGSSTRLASAEVYKDGPDETAPSVSVSNPLPGAVLRQSVTLYANASDNVGVTGVEFYRDGVLIGAATQPSPTSSPNLYSLSWNLAGVPNGPYVLTARARDAAGLVSTSAGVSVTVDNDLTPPSVSLTSPAAGASVSMTATLTASATDNVGISRVEFYRGTTLLGSDAYSPYSASWDTTLVPNGAYTLTARAVDTTGNMATSAEVAVTVDNETVPPTVTLTAPGEGAILSGTITLTADAADNVGVTQVVFSHGGTVIGTDTTAPYSVTWNTRGVANGAYVLTARAQDAVRNTQTSVAVNVTVDNDFTAPSTTLTAPSAGAVLSGTVTLAASATDNLGVARVEFYRGTTLLGSDDTAPYSLAWDTRTTANGGYTLTSKAFDTSGNAASSAGVSVTVSNAVVELVTNGGFEGSISPWVLSGQAFHMTSGTGARSGTGWLELGRSDSVTGSAEQQLTLQAGAPSLTFWLVITTSESTTTTTQWDKLYIEVLSTSGTVLGTLGTFSNVNHGSTYVQRTFSLTSYAGQTVRLRFRATTDSSLPTTFRLDDVSVK